MRKPQGIFLAILILLLALILDSNFYLHGEKANSESTGKEVVLNVSKLNTSSGFKLPDESKFEVNFKVEMFVNENRSLKAIKTIFLKNIGKSEKGVIAIYYLYPTIKIDRIVLKGLKLENAR